MFYIHHFCINATFVRYLQKEDQLKICLEFVLQIHYKQTCLRFLQCKFVASCNVVWSVPEIETILFFKQNT